MTPVFSAPIILPDFILQTSEKFCSALVVSFTALLYLAMTLTPLLREPDTKPPEPESPNDTFDQGEKK